jgi:hypothetical protein
MPSFVVMRSGNGSIAPNKRGRWSGSCLIQGPIRPCYGQWQSRR